MRTLILTLFSVLLTQISFGQETVKDEQQLQDRYEIREETEAEKKIKPRPYIGNAAKAGGGDIVTTDCYSFVPVPEDAIALDNNDSDFGNSLDGAWGPFPLDFSFCHFGDNYTQFYVNMKGNITFDNFNTTFVPAGFPSNDFAMISGFWADIDLRCDDCGQVYYWTTPTAAYITFVDVGYYNNHGNLNNTFQIVITDQTDDVVGEGNNVGLFYQDMQWAAGDWNGGAGGFGGTAASTVGANKNDGLNFIQFGRFLTDSYDYDGPFGNDDGVHWLDDKAFVFNVCTTNDNLPPIPNNADACDTIFICQNDTYDFNVSFLPPEGAQTVTVTVDDSEADGFVETDSGDGFMTGVFTGSAANVGVHTLVFTGSDSGTPTGVTAVTYNIEVIDTTLPDLTVSGDGLVNDVITFCGGTGGAELTASDGFDNYVWSNNTNGQTGFLDGGEFTLVAILDGCEAEYGPITAIEVPIFNPDVVSESFTVCSGETTLIEVEDSELYSEILWSINSPGDILTADLTSPEIEVIEGIYQVTVTDAESGCEGFRLVPINIDPIYAPDFPGLDCGDKEVCWSGSWANPEDCAHFIYMDDSEGDTWEGANVEVYVNGVGPLNYTISNGATFLPDGVVVTNGDVVDYYFTSGLDDNDIRVRIFNCENDVLFDSDNAGDILTPGLFFSQVANTDVNELTGSWEVLSGPITFDDVNTFDNCVSVPNDFLGACEIEFTADVCSFTETYDLLFSEPASVTVPNSEVTGCEGDVLIEPTYFPSEDIDPITYDWTPNLECEGNPDCVVSSTVNICIEPENSCGNANEECVQVNVIPTPSANLTESSFCDSSSEVIDAGDSQDVSFEYVWTTGSTDPTVTINSSQDLGVTISNECGESSDNAFIQFNDSPVVQPWAYDTLVCAGETIDINPNWTGLTGDVTWAMSWIDQENNPQSMDFEENGGVLTFGSDQIPLDALDSETIISYSYTNSCGTASGQVITGADACFIAATNVFSPDNDGLDGGQFSGGMNEAWYIIGIDGVNNVEVKIYDRWGTLVYESDNYSNQDPWDGTNTNGDDLTEGVYFYHVVTPKGNSEIQGTVTILRKG